MRSLVACSLALLVSACAAPVQNAMSSTEEVRAATVAWRTAYDSRDPARITSQYAPDAVLWGTTAKKLAASPPEIAEYFKTAAARPNARVKFGQEHIRVYGDVAANTGDYEFTDVREGKAVSTPSRYTLVFRKQGGKWLIVEHHSSRIPE